MKLKMKLKNITISAICLSVMLSIYILPAPAQAQDNKGIGTQKIVYEQKEITDKEILLERAKKGISDTDNNEIKEIDVKNARTGEVKKAKLYTTTQKLKAEMLTSGGTRETFATTTIAEYDGSRSNSGDDESYSVKAYSTFYWNEENHNNIKHLRLINATGSWVSSDSQIRTLYHKARLLAFGWTFEGIWSSQQQDFTNVTSSFNVSAPSDWKSISSVQGRYGNFGVLTMCNVQDIGSGDIWYMELTNYLPL